MPRRKIKFRAGEVYHVYNRGVNRQPIFFCRENWLYYIRQLKRYFRTELADILAYCLMPNHYHLMIQLKIDQLGEKIMQPLGIAFTKAVNSQQGRVGPIFQGPFKGVEVSTDEQLVHLSRYIHLNPVRAGLVDNAEAWEFSSYREMLGLCKATVCNPEPVLAYFASRQAYREFVEDDQEADVIQPVMLA